MAKGIKLKIHLPDTIFRDVLVEKVQIPSKNGVLTLLSERAPGVFMLDIGLIKILDEKNATVEAFFVKSGVVEFAQATCKVMVEHIMEYASMTIAEAKAAVEKAELPEDKTYFEFVEKTLRMDKK